MRVSDPVLLSESKEVQDRFSQMLRETLEAIFRSYSDDSAFSGIDPYELREKVCGLGFLPEKGKVFEEVLKATEKVIEARHSDDMKVAQGAGVRPKDVDELSHIEVSTRDSVTAPVKVEPFGGLSTHFEDAYTRIDVRIDSLKLATIDYEMRDSIVVISSRKRHKILFGLIKWKGKAKIEAFSRNPKATVTSVEVLERLE